MGSEQKDTTEYEFEKEVKEFGNSGHVTLPKEFIGETVAITPIQSTTDQTHQIHPPVTREKIKSTLSEATRSDFKRIQREDDNFPRECQFQYQHDIRLTINVDLVHEGSEHPYQERGTIVYFIWQPTPAELDEHTDWFDQDEDEVKWEMVYALDSSVDDLFDHPLVVYNDFYKYSVNWNGSTVYSTKFSNRGAKNGRFYYPRWGGYSSVSEYQSSIDYTIATAISEAPDEEYNRYLNALQLDETEWGDKDTPLEFDREDILNEANIYSA